MTMHTMFRFFLSGFATLALVIVPSCNTSETKRAETKAVYIKEQNTTPTVDLPGYTLLEDDGNRRDDAAAILHVKRSWPLVMQTPSREGFDSLLAQNFIFTDNGKILNREEYIFDRIAASDWKITHVIYRNVTLQFIDATTALLSYRNEVTNTHTETGEIEVEYITWTDVYTRENNTWKISAAHVIDFRIEQANNTSGSTATHEVKNPSFISRCKAQY